MAEQEGKTIHSVAKAIRLLDLLTAAAQPASLTELYQKTGWHLGLGLLAQEIRWMKDNEPELFRKTAMFLSVPSYISYRMTGVAACDLSDAGIDQLADIRRGAYDEALLAYAGISAEQLPKLVRSGDRIGQLTPQAAQAATAAPRACPSLRALAAFLAVKTCSMAASCGR